VGGGVARAVSRRKGSRRGGQLVAYMSMLSAIAVRQGRGPERMAALPRVALPRIALLLAGVREVPPQRILWASDRGRGGGGGAGRGRATRCPARGDAEPSGPRLDSSVHIGADEDERASAWRSASGSGRWEGFDFQARAKNKVSRMMREYEVWSVFFQLTGSFFLIGSYIAQTYVNRVPRFVHVAEAVLCLGLLVDYVIRMVRVPRGARLRKAVTFESLTDLLSVAPTLVETGFMVTHAMAGLAIAPWVSALRLLRALRMSRLALVMPLLRDAGLLAGEGSSSQRSNVDFRIYRLAVGAVAALLFSSSVMQVATKQPFHEAAYFVVATVTTGRSPLGAVPKYLVMAFFLFGIAFVPQLLSNILDLLKNRKFHRGALVRGDPVRAPTLILFQRLVSFSSFYGFFTELFSDVHHIPRNLRLVCVCSNQPEFSFRTLQEMRGDRLTLYEGTALDAGDLDAVHAEDASGWILVSDPFAPDPDAEDNETLLKVWSLKKLSRAVPLFVQVLTDRAMRRVRPFLDLSQDTIVCVNNTRAGLIAISCLCPGASTLLANLLRSQDPTRSDADIDPISWEALYCDGARQQIFSNRSLTLDDCLAGANFMDLAKYLIERTGVVLLGLVKDDHGELSVALNPLEYYVVGGEMCIMLTYTEDGAAAAVDCLNTADMDQMRGVSTDLGEWSSDGECPQALFDMIVRGEGHSHLGAFGLDVDDSDDPAPAFDPSKICDHVVVMGDVVAGIEPFLDALRRAEGVDLKKAAKARLGFGYGSYPRGEEVIANTSRVPVVIVHPGLSRTMVQRIKELDKNVYVVEGRSTSATDLVRAGVRRARAVCMLNSRARLASSLEATSFKDRIVADADALMAIYKIEMAVLSEGIDDDIVSDPDEPLALSITPRDHHRVHAVVELTSTKSVLLMDPKLLQTYKQRILGQRGSGRQRRMKNPFEMGLQSRDMASSHPATVDAVGAMTSAGQGDQAPKARAIRVLRRTRRDTGGWQLNPYFASGSVYVPALVDTFSTSCSRVNVFPGLVDEVLSVMLFGSSGEKGRGLLQVAAPEELIGQPYGELTKLIMVCRSFIPLGLYRCSGGEGGLPYVITNPDLSLRVRRGDWVFVVRPTDVPLNFVDT